MILSDATIGQVGNLQHELVNVGKAGRSRWKGVRPTVRGSVIMITHGGGEGRAPIGRPSQYGVNLRLVRKLVVVKIF